jgi:hypothetical protein
VQIASLTRWVGHLVNTVGGALASGDSPNSAHAKVIAGCILTFNVAVGFPLGYVITTLWYKRTRRAGRERCDPLTLEFASAQARRTTQGVT